MAYKNTNATAWGVEDLYIEPALTNGKIPSSFTHLLGNIKEGSLALNIEDGKKKEWIATGGRVIDSYKGEPKVSIKLQLKNLHKETLEKVWKVKLSADTNRLEVVSMTNSNHYAIRMDSDVVGSEVVTFAKCSVSAQPTYSEEDGWGLDLEFTALTPENNEPKWVIEIKA